MNDFTSVSYTHLTKVLSDWIKVRVTTNPGETFLDRMIGLVEGAKRQKTPNEIALTPVSYPHLLQYVYFPTVFYHSMYGNDELKMPLVSTGALCDYIACLLYTSRCV